MDFTAIKKYPSQISSAFKRFPLAVALAFFTFIALVTDTEFAQFGNDHFTRLFVWLAIYPIAAMLTALATSLVQESRKSANARPQAIASGAWFLLSIALVAGLSFDDDPFYFGCTVTLVYLIATFAVFLGPFWKQPNENGFWNFLQKNIKSAIIAILVSAILLGALEGFVFGFAELFDTDPGEMIYLYIFYFCASVVVPILYFSGIPSIDECIEEPPALSKFASSTIRFLFIPVLAIGILLFYAYIIKFIVLWDMPDEGTASAFVSGFIIYLLALITAMHPMRLSAEQTTEKKLLKIFPAACIPLVVLMSIDIMHIFIQESLSPEIIWVIVINIYFYIIIAILLKEKIQRKSRYIAIAFCALFFITTISPLNAQNIADFAGMKIIENEPTQQSNTKTTQIEEDTTAKFDSFEADISNSDIISFIIPEGAKEVAILDHYFDKSEFEYRGDTITFRITLSEDDESDENAADSSATKPSAADSNASDSAKTKSRVYSFYTTKQELNDSLESITTDHAAIGIKELHTGQWSKTGRSLRIKGLLFTE
ncbi:DUF4153 domain-containing protein [uncultured Fibrobacter sp.]|uniref:DUF4153 domain-containing protein n=1 Tax=uncultured Fibrobacter sp. TaxID=261512 RepID=UPI0025EFC30F|nr:DUF4153 domain-containing protein [uncultured Fibrobacter sp.]